MRPMVMVPDVDCEEANGYREALFGDPITRYYGATGDAMDSWMRRHVKECEACRRATEEANMP